MKIRKFFIFFSILGLAISFSTQAKIFDNIRSKMFQWNFNVKKVLIFPQQVGNYIDSGKLAITNKDIIAARENFSLAVIAEPDNQEANFWYALTRILAVYEKGKNTTVPNLTSLKGLALALGINFITFGLFETEAITPDQIPQNAPTVNDIKNFIKNELLPEVNGAITNMEKVSNENFSSNITINGSTINVDYADVVIVKSAVYALKTSIELLLAYNLQLTNIPDIFNGDMQDVLRIRKMFEQNSNFLTPEEPTRLVNAKQSLIEFIDTYNLGAQKLRTRSRVSGHLFVVDLVPPDNGNVNFYVTSDETQNFQNVLTDLKNSLLGPYVCNNILPDETDTREKTLDLSKLFNPSNPLNFKNLFFDKNYDLYLHDPTLGGVFPHKSEIIYIEIPLVEGWNLISIPLVIRDTSVSSVLKSIEGNYMVVWGYDPNQGWRKYIPGRNDNTLTNLEPGKGYWIYVKKNYYGPLAIGLYGFEPPRSITLKKGWNLIGYPGAYDFQTTQDGVSGNSNIKYLWAYTVNKKWLFYSPSVTTSLYEPFVHFIKSQAFWVYASEDTIFEPPKMTESNPKGYEVWAGVYFDLMPKTYLYAEPQRAGWKFVTRVGPDDPNYGNKTINLPQGTKYVMIKKANPLSSPIKIDGIALDGECFNKVCSGSYCWNNPFMFWPMEDTNDYKIDSFVDNLSTMYQSLSCTDGWYFTLNGGAAIVIAKRWVDTPSITNIIIYGVK